MVCESASNGDRWSVRGARCPKRQLKHAHKNPVYVARSSHYEWTMAAPPMSVNICQLSIGCVFLCHTECVIEDGPSGKLGETDITKHLYRGNAEI